MPAFQGCCGRPAGSRSPPGGVRPSARARWPRHGPSSSPRRAATPDWVRSEDREAIRLVDLAEHEALAEAVLRRDGEQAQARLIDHFATTARRMGFTLFWDEIGQPADHE